MLKRLTPDDAFLVVEYLTTRRFKDTILFNKKRKIKEIARKVRTNQKHIFISPRKDTKALIKLECVKKGVLYTLLYYIPVRKEYVEAMAQFYPYKA